MAFVLCLPSWPIHEVPGDPTNELWLCHENGHLCCTACVPSQRHPHGLGTLDTLSLWKWARTLREKSVPPVTPGPEDGAQSRLALPCGLSFPSQGCPFLREGPQPHIPGSPFPEPLAGPVGGGPHFLSVEAVLELLVTSSWKPPRAAQGFAWGPCGWRHWSDGVDRWAQGEGFRLGADWEQCSVGEMRALGWTHS